MESDKVVANISNMVNKIYKKFNNEGILALTIFILFLIVIAIVFVSLYINWLLHKKDEYGCKKISSLVPAKLVSIDASGTYNYPVNFYYIKTAYNCCSEGKYAIDYVNLCILEKVITQGVRCFDFEIFNKDDIAIVSTSNINNYWVKETFNEVLFSSAL